MVETVVDCYMTHSSLQKFTIFFPLLLITWRAFSLFFSYANVCSMFQMLFNSLNEQMSICIANHFNVCFEDRRVAFTIVMGLRILIMCCVV